MLDRNEILVRLRKTVCTVSRRADNLAKSLFWGLGMKACINRLAKIEMYIDILKCYEPSSTVGCLSYDKVLNVFDDLQELLGIKFAPEGVFASGSNQYIDPNTATGVITENLTLATFETITVNLGGGLEDMLEIEQSKKPCC